MFLFQICSEDCFQYKAKCTVLPVWLFLRTKNNIGTRYVADLVRMEYRQMLYVFRVFMILSTGMPYVSVDHVCFMSKELAEL